MGAASVSLGELTALYEGRLESVFPNDTVTDDSAVEPFTWCGRTTCHEGKPIAKPRVLIPVFPGTNCEYDTAAAFE